MFSSKPLMLTIGRPAVFFFFFFASPTFELSACHLTFLGLKDMFRYQGIQFVPEKKKISSPLSTNEAPYPPIHEDKPFLPAGDHHVDR